MKPLVAIVGRPNVGKSTLFNRLLGRPHAIVEDIPGTTRDRIYADVSLGLREVSLVDTGGLEVSPGTAMAQKIKAQVEMALAEADVVLFLVDVKDGVTPADGEIAQVLRQSQKPVVLVANKADNEQRRMEALEFHELSLGEPLPISAYHDLGIYDLQDKVLALLPPSSPEPPLGEMPRVAIVGRPNVGKSLLLNAILQQERAVVDDRPGTTRDALDTAFHYDDKALLLIDTAGIRKRGRIEGGIEQYSVLRALRAIGRADIALLVMDASEGVTAQDTHIAGYILDAHKGMVLVVNKWDLVEPEKRDRRWWAEAIQDRFHFATYAPIQFVSARLRRGIKGLLQVVEQVWQERLKRIPTAQLNSLLQEAVAAHPPFRGGRQLKLFYAAQVGVNPPDFVLFVNDATLVHFSYRRYLENRLRQAFGFRGSALRLIFKGRGEAR